MENITDLTLFSIIAAIVSIIAAVISIYKARPERRKLEAESLASIAGAAESIANGAKVSNEELAKRIEDMEAREIKREEEVRSLKKELMNVNNKLDEWKDYAMRLNYQVRSYGREPVPFKPKSIMATDK